MVVTFLSLKFKLVTFKLWVYLGRQESCPAALGVVRMATDGVAGITVVATLACRSKTNDALTATANGCCYFQQNTPEEKLT